MFVFGPPGYFNGAMLPVHIDEIQSELFRPQWRNAMKLIVAILGFFSICTVNAAEVRWDVFHFWSSQFEGAVCGYYDLGHSSPEIELRYFYNSTGSRLVKVDGKGENVNVGWNVALWVLAMEGDVLSKEYFSQPHVVLKDSYNPMIDQSSMLPVPDHIAVNSVGDTIDIHNGERFYLALIGYWYEDIDSSIDPLPIPDLADFYGWVELEAGQKELNILGSAFSYSPLVVGGGSVATPEPSAGVLLLLGLAGLVLRRRPQRRCYDIICADQKSPTEP